jgi:TRAP-type uncharacterized transport system fused permease subunit
VSETPAKVSLEELTEEYESERPGPRLAGIPALIVAAAGVGLSCYALWWVLNPISAQEYRTTFLAVVLAMTFLVYRGWGKRPERKEGEPPPAERPGVTDWLLTLLAVVALGYTLVTFEEIHPALGRAQHARHRLRPGHDRAGARGHPPHSGLDPAGDLPVVRRVLLLRQRDPAELGDQPPRLWHRPLVGQSYMGLEGIFGVPLDVAATYIILFTIYGAVLEYSGAGKFFIDLSFAAFGPSRTGPGRTTALAGFLLGTVSGSGVATTVTLGSVTWPILRKAG